MRLPFVLNPETDESARGFIVRLAEENGVQSDQMCEWLELPSGSRPLTGPAEHAAAMMAVDPAIFEKMGFDQGEATWVLGHPMPRPFLLDYTLRVCPACLSERAYHRRVWDLRHVQYCPRHQIPLLTHCPNPQCGGVLRWSRWSLTSCHCGESLAFTEGHQSVNNCAVEEMIYSRTGLGHVFELPAFEGVPLPEMLDVLLFFGRMDRVAAVDDPGQLSRMRLFTDRRVLARGLEIAQTWPASFEDLASRVRAGRLSQAGVSRQYGPLHRFIEKHGEAAYAATLRRAYRDHLVGRGDIEPKAFPTFLDPPQRLGQDMVSKAELRSRLGHDQTTFARLMRGPWGQTLQLVPGAGTGLPVYKQGDVDAFVERMNRLITFREADRVLGLRDDSTRELIASGLIKAPPQLTKSRVDGSALDRREVEGLFDRIRSVSTAAPPVMPVPFAAVVDRTVRKGAGRISDVIQGVLKGKLRGCLVAPDQPGFRGLAFDEAEVASFLLNRLSRTRNGRMLTSEVGARLMIRPDGVRWLVQAGHLPRPQRQGTAFFLAANAVEQFAHKYVSITELAERMQMDARRIWNQLAKFGVSPILMSPQGVRGVTLYLRDDVGLVEIGKILKDTQ